ncbi:Filamin-B [Hypsibius exemplaris]|uniref:Filamin-B n=1 Tax=Hypsibius exemplaris TaxID=2072580 RepID=A0A1W0X7M7_HYPEX|nr:Filamin-B [Hypsibius exemplaris]
MASVASGSSPGRLTRQASSPLSGERSGFLASNRARSREGHAAAPMGIKDDDQRWVQIQQKTFTNWVNEQLKSVGKRVENLQTDFQDGLNLIALIEVLQGRRIGKAFQNPVNQHQMLENVQLALNAIMDDNIKLVNIGNQDLVEGNLKLILGLVWTLILRYQIGKTNLPPKKLMLAWLQAALRDMKIKNFTRDWNDGVALSGILEYCKPGLFPNWRTMDRSNRVENCRRAMEVAEREFGIPMLISPEDLSSPDLDELSGMTYLSYFMNSPTSPGYKATLRWVRGQIPDENVENFTMDWNDGRVVGALVKSLGATVPGYTTQTYDRYNWEDNLQRGFKGGRELGVEPILTPKQMAEAVEEHLGTMAYAAWFQSVSPLPIRKGGEKIKVSGEGLHTAYINKPAHFQIQFIDDVDPSTIRAELRGPSGTIPVKLKLGENGGSATYQATATGPHELFIYCEGELIRECPRKVRVHPDISKVKFAGIHKPVALGQTVDMQVDAKGAGKGELVVEARAPSGRLMKCPVTEQNGGYSAKFQPDEIGEWNVGILFDGTHIKGSPFTCNVFDPNQVKVSGLDVGVVGQDMDFAVDTSRAGQGEATVEIFYQGRSVPAKINTLGNGLFKVTFTPHGPGLYTIHVYFNGVEVRGSPFTIEIFDTSTVSASGEGLKLVPVNKQAFFAINTKGATSKDLQVRVTGPSGRAVPVQIQDKGPNSYNAVYVPTEVGRHSIDISFFEKAIRGSPFECFAYDAKMIRVSPIPNGFVGKPVEFEIDGSQAGSGNLEILVNGGRVVSHVKALGNQRFLASFTPMDAMTHVVEMRFNGETVPGSPWDVEIWDPRNVQVKDIPKLFQIGRTVAFEINASQVGPGDLNVAIKSPSMRTISSHTTQLRTGIYRCEFSSTEVGTHSIEVTYHNEVITGSPFITKGFDANAVKISKISNALVGLPVQFTVDASLAGEGQLEISINNGRVPNKVDVLGGGKVLVTFTPQVAQPHFIDVKFNGEQVPGCPVECKVFDTSRITASGRGLERVCVGRAEKFQINTAGAGEAEIAVSIASPFNRPVRNQISALSHTGYEVTWTAQEVGTHMVNIEYATQIVGNSPYPVKAYDPTKVKVSDIENGFVGKPVLFTVDAAEAGEGNVEIVVTDQHSRQVATRVEQLGAARYQISFIATEAVHHRIDITFNKDPVPGTPFGVDIMDASKVQVIGEGLRVAQVRQVATFQVITRGAGNEEVQVSIEGPDGRQLPARVLNNRDQTYTVEYIATSAGDHQIMVTYGGMKAGASPYTAKAFDVNAVKVGEIPDGLVGRPVTFTVDASLAGSGNLEVAVNNGRVQTTAESLGNNRYAITFTPRSTEDHMIDIKFNGFPVPGGPFRCKIIDASRVTATGEERVPVNKVAFFTIDARGAGPADCEVVITGPSGRNVPVRLSGSHSSSFRAEYTPTEVGDYQVVVRYAGLDIPSSPLVARAYDADRVIVSQTKTGFVGKPVSFHVDASQAGAGNLEIVISVGGKNVPNFVQAEGNAKFKVSFTPQEALPHQVRVRFNNHIVPGTPYDVEIVDGSKCTATGDGLRLVPVNKPALFTVDPRGAGQAELNIQITGSSQTNTEHLDG